MAKRQKNRQHNGQKTEEQTTQWPKDRRTDNTMTKKKKNRQHNDQKTEEQTTQWPKEKGQQRSTKHTHKTKDRVILTPSFSTIGTRGINLVTNPVISH
jgi:hypothetical protein